jgi:hypothetical protein
MLVAPAASMSERSSTVTGAALCRPICGRREPVTTTSSSSDSGAFCAFAEAEIANDTAAARVIRVRLTIADPVFF